MLKFDEKLYEQSVFKDSWIRMLLPKDGFAPNLASGEAVVEVGI